MGRAIFWAVEATLISFLLVMLFGCTTEQIEQTNRRLIESERVAYTACLARERAPIVALALRTALEEAVPGGTVAHGVIAGSCEVILANPGTTVTFMTWGQGD
jgi:hypothetical protein